MLNNLLISAAAESAQISDVDAALRLMGAGFALVFGALIVLYGAIKLLTVIFKDNGNSSGKE